METGGSGATLLNELNMGCVQALRTPEDGTDSNPAGFIDNQIGDRSEILSLLNGVIQTAEPRS